VYQTKLNLDPEEPLDKRVVLIDDPRWDECISEWEKSKVFGVDIETYGEKVKRGKKTLEYALDPIRGRIRLIQVGLLSGKVLIANLGGWVDNHEQRLRQYSYFLSILKKKMNDKSIVKVGQNLKFEMTFLRWKFGIVTRNVRDTMLMSQTLWSIGGKGGERYLHNLGAIGGRLGFEISKDQQKSDWGGELSNSQLNYAALDAHIVLPIAKKFKELLIADNLWGTAMLENMHCPCVAEREYWGMPVDESILDELLQTYSNAAEEAIQPFKDEFPGINPRSHDQTTPILNERFRLNLIPPEKTKHGRKRKGQKEEKKNKKKSENKNKMILMENTHIPAIDALLLYRSIITQSGTYFPSIKENIYMGRVRSQYSQLAGTDGTDEGGERGKGSGRSSSRNPNLQNPANHAPRWEAIGLAHPRSAFKAPQGNKMIVADLSQAHMRIATEYSQDPVLVDAYNDPDEDRRDIHAITACAQAQSRGLGLDWTPENILKWRKDSSHPNSLMAEVLRKTSKNVNYGSLNLQGAKTLQFTMATSRDPLFETEDKCRKDLNIWKETYSTLAATQRKIIDDANSYDLELPGLSGRFGMTRGPSGRRVFFQKRLKTFNNKTSWEVDAADAVSSIWLGTEAHIIKKSEYLILDELDAHPEWGWRIINNAHDELDLEGPEETAEPVAIMVNKIMDDCMREFIKSIPVNEPNYDPLKTICDSWNEK